MPREISCFSLLMSRITTSTAWPGCTSSDGWLTRRVNHPSELVQPGQAVEVVILDINKEKQEISLGMKQTEINPWELVGEKYPPGTGIEGQVRNLGNYVAVAVL